MFDEFLNTPLELVGMTSVSRDAVSVKMYHEF